MPLKDKILRKDYIQSWRKQNANRLMLNHRRYRDKLKLSVLTHYGPDHKLGCCWPDCPVIDIDMLSLDHINNDGAEHRRTLKAEKRKSGSLFYKWIRVNKYPEGFQTLCFNHQMKKEILRKRQ